MGGVALADRGRWRDTSDRSGGIGVRDHRHTYQDRRSDRRYDRRHDRRVYRNNHRHVVQRRPVYVNNGRFVFNGGFSRTYTRPIIRQRYYDYRYRPQILVENYQPVAGYRWIPGH